MPRPRRVARLRRSNSAAASVMSGRSCSISMLGANMSLTGRIAGGVFLISHDVSAGHVKMIYGPQAGGRKNQQREAQRCPIRNGATLRSKYIAQDSHDLRSNDEVEHIAHEQGPGREHGTHTGWRKVLHQAHSWANVEINGR